jgi:hypothetical protein
MTQFPYELLQYIYLLCDPQDRRKFWGLKACGEALRKTRRRIDVKLKETLELALAARKPHVDYRYNTGNVILPNEQCGPTRYHLVVSFDWHCPGRLVYFEEIMTYADERMRSYVGHHSRVIDRTGHFFVRKNGAHCYKLAYYHDSPCDICQADRKMYESDVIDYSAPRRMFVNRE